MLTYRVTLNVPTQSAALVSRWLGAHRRTHDLRPWQRAATPYVQAILALRWFTERTDVDLLARNAGISIATAYRYLHEAIDVIAAMSRTCTRSSPVDTNRGGSSSAWMAL